MYKKIWKSFVASAVIAVSLFSVQIQAHAADPVTTLKVATGPKGKGYSKLFQDIKSTCGDKIALVEVNTEGGLDNLNALSTKKAQVGFAQIDTLVSMRASDENIAGLQQIAALNNNYLHVLTSVNGYTTSGQKKWGGLSTEKDKVEYIRQFSQLRGKPVALVGSAKLMGQKLNKALGFNMITIDAADDATAQEMVRKNQVAAAFTVSGWPSGMVDKLTPGNGLTMANFDVPVAAPLVVKPVTYRGIGVYGVQALASRNVLLSRPFKGPNAKLVADLKKCIADNLQNYVEGEFEPGWNEVKSVDLNLGIDLFSAK